MIDDGGPSVTARRVAAYRLSFERLSAPGGDPDAEERLARDVAGSVTVDAAGRMARYLRGRTAFFDRVVVNGLGRGVMQVVNVGAGYDGRSLRYATPDVHWWEVDHPSTQADKRSRMARLGIDAPQLTFVAHDLRTGGLARALIAHQFHPDSPSLFLCEGVAVYLEVGVLEAILHDLRSVATVGTRLACSFGTSAGEEDHAARREQFRAAVAAMGEPALSSVTGDDAAALLSTTRWRVVELSERSQRAGFIVAAPLWAPAVPPTPETIGRVGAFMERMLHRAGTDQLAAHIESTYGVAVRRIKELDLGVHRVDRADGSRWVARVFPAARPIASVHADAQLLEWLVRAGVPAERCAHTEPVSQLAGQGILVTTFVPGQKLKPSSESYQLLGALLGRLHSMTPDRGLTFLPGGAWHHLVPAGGPADELAAAAALLHDARHRVPRGERPQYEALVDDLGRAEAFGNLPEALIHPDLVPRNAVRATAGEVTVVDWAGAGRGPRLQSLGCLLWAAAAKTAWVDAAVAGYRRLAEPDPAELDRLEPAMAARPLSLAVWTFATGRGTLADVTQWWGDQRATVKPAAGRARERFDQPRPAAPGEAGA